MRFLTQRTQSLLRALDRMNLAKSCHSLRERVGVRGVLNGFYAIDSLTLSVSRRERGLILSDALRSDISTNFSFLCLCVEC